MLNKNILPVTGEFDLIPADLYIKHYATWKRLNFDAMTPLADAGACTGIWIYGPSGCGKSRKARADYPDYYLKAANKWWDGYKGQENVILEDLGKEHACLGHHLKLWADRHDFISELKGASIRIRPAVFCVTSQYAIEDIWADAETREALHRRFKVIHMGATGPLPDLLNKDN